MKQIYIGCRKNYGELIFEEDYVHTIVAFTSQQEIIKWCEKEIKLIDNKYEFISTDYNFNKDINVTNILKKLTIGTKETFICFDAAEFTKIKTEKIDDFSYMDKINSFITIEIEKIEIPDDTNTLFFCYDENGGKLINENGEGDIFYYVFDREEAIEKFNAEIISSFKMNFVLQESIDLLRYLHLFRFKQKEDLDFALFKFEPENWDEYYYLFLKSVPIL